MRLILDLQSCQAVNRKRGIGRYSMSLACAVAKVARNHEVLIALNGQFQDSVDDIRLEFQDLIPPDQIVVFDIPGPTAEGYPENIWRTKTAEMVRENFLANLKPDIIHVTSLFEGFEDDAVSSVNLLENLNTAVTLYDLIPLQDRETYLSDQRLVNWYYRKLQSIKNAQLLMAISEYTRREALSLLHLDENQVVNISSAADSVFRPMNLNQNEFLELNRRYGISLPTILCTGGGQDPRKNLAGLIRAFATLPTYLRDQHQLVIVCKIGDAEIKRLNGISSSLGIQKGGLVFTGFVPDQDLVALYNTCKLFVNPSLSEGFGLPVLEAMACGAPVIGSNATSIPEVIGRVDALFDPINPSAIGEKIYQCLIDDGFRKSLCDHGLTQAKKFSWQKSAEKVLESFEGLHAIRKDKARIKVSSSTKPRLAYVSPLPPVPSGISDYSAEILPELARDYEIEVVVDQPKVTDPWITANFPVRTCEWFNENSSNYDRILYHFGNNFYHEKMFSLLKNHPGAVLLHDFFLSGVLEDSERRGSLPQVFLKSLYDSHGYGALQHLKNHGRESATWKYPCNKMVLDNAVGVLLHSFYALNQTNFWYGLDEKFDARFIDFPRSCPEPENKDNAKERLGFKAEDFVVCSFGFLGQTKSNDRLLSAWLNSDLAIAENTHLVFVGENHGGEYGSVLKRKIDNCKRISITGYVSLEQYKDWLAAVDLAVQLRTKSRGETSAAIFDNLVRGTPLIVNSHGTMSELSEDLVCKLEDNFSDHQLQSALEALWKNEKLRQQLSVNSREYAKANHQPSHVARLYKEALEDFYTNSVQTRRRRLVNAIARLAVPNAPDQRDLLGTAMAIAENQPSQGQKQLLVDISELVQMDAATGIQRVVKNILAELVANPPNGYRVEPIYEDGGFFRFARRFALDLVTTSELVIADDIIEVKQGDIFLGLDLLPIKIPRNEKMLAHFKERGVRIFFVVYDLLILQRPDCFGPGATEYFTPWVETISCYADGLVCISGSVADEVRDWLNVHPPLRKSPLQISHFHLGADFVKHEGVGRKVSANPEQNVAFSSPTFLLVGTLEPRKGHTQTLDAFELLWNQGVDSNLVFVGKQGWMMNDLIVRLRSHAEFGKRLFWLEGISDEYLENVYADSTCLIAASECEGFGLPLIEAAQHKLPIIARDIPVFREVAGDFAYYFSGVDPQALADAIKDWLDLKDEGNAPLSTNMPWLTWHQSTKQMLEVIIPQDAIIMEN